MSHNRYECPACEFVFSVREDEVKETLQCPDCGTHIPATSARSFGIAAPRVAPRSHVPLPTPQRVAERRRTPPPPGRGAGRAAARVAAPPRDEGQGIKVARPAEQTARSSVAAQASATAPSLGHSENRWKSAGTPTPAGELARRKSGRRLIALLTTLAVAFASLGAAGYFLFLKDGGVFGTSAADELASQAEDALTPATNTEPDADAATPEPRILLSADEVNSVWDEAAPYIVQLECESLSGSRTGAGILIDTRGWIATSLHLVAGAANVSVRFADGTHAEGSTKPREIRSRGMIAYDVNHDLAIVSISADELKVEDDIVLSIDRFPAADAALIACGAPATGSWLEACSMLSNETREVDFFSAGPGTTVPVSDSELETDLMALQLPADPRFDGGPLLRADGAVAGILVGGQPEWSNAHAVSVKHLRRLRDFAEDLPGSFGSPELLSLARSSGGAVAGGGENRAVAETEAAPGTVASRETIIELQQRCSLLKWNPQTANEYALLTELAQYLTAAEDIAADESADEGTRLLLDEPAQSVRKELSSTGWPDEAAIARINGFAMASIEANELGVYCYAKVELPPGLSPEMNGTGTVTLSLLGTDQRIILPVSESHEFLTSGSEWLVVGTRTKTRAVVVEDERTGLRSEIPLVHAIYLVERPEQIARLRFAPLGTPGNL